MKQLLIAAALGAAATQLSGCVPVVAAGAGAGVMMTEDRRSSGIYIEDENIELKAMNLVRNEIREDANLNFTSFNRNVLITGQAPTEDVKMRTEKLVRDISNVRNVFNELAVAGKASFSARGSDAYTTTKVKTRFIESDKVNAQQVKVVTENSVVYLMGLVTQQEGDEAARIASETGGVKKVVKVFEYIPAPGAEPATPAPITGK